MSCSQYPDFEIVVCDDCSTDGTLAYLRDYARQEPRLKIVESARNLGASATRNQAVRHADGAILVFLDNDTEVEPDWLRELRRRPDREIAAAVFSEKGWCGMIAHYVRCNYLRH